MKTRNKITVVISALLLISFLTACVTKTRVHINSEVEGAKVYIDGEYVGTTPTVATVSNAAWLDQEVILTKEGYKPLHTDLNKEIKIGNVISGIFFWIPLLWCWGPKQNQFYIIYPDERDTVFLNFN